MRPVGWLIALSLIAAPALAGPGGEYDPCRNQGTRRISIVYARASGLLGRESECKGEVYPSKKVVCQGDTVVWSVINTCDVEQVSDIRIEGLERVTETCRGVARLPIGAAKEMRCRIRRKLPENVKQEYEVRGRIGKSPTVIDPEMDIRQPR